jgi:DNA-binding response OmpR family regulator
MGTAKNENNSLTKSKRNRLYIRTSSLNVSRLLDIRMPRLNGLQLFYRIKAISPNTKIIFCSALDIAEEMTSILPDIKYEDIIKKPVEREYFINKINSALNNNSGIHFDSLST